MLEVYSAAWCSPCNSLKKTLDTNNIEYTVIDIDEEPVRSQEAGIRGIPTVVNPKTLQTRVGNLTLTQIQEMIKD